jgi:hypothetical protein
MLLLLESRPVVVQDHANVVEPKRTLGDRDIPGIEVTTASPNRALNAGAKIMVSH